MKSIKIIICIVILLGCVNFTTNCFSQDIKKSIPVTEFDKDVQEALKLLHKDLYDLVKMHDQNMILLSRDINYILKEIKTFKKEIESLKIRVDLLEDPNKGVD